MHSCSEMPILSEEKKSLAKQILLHEVSRIPCKGGREMRDSIRYNTMKKSECEVCGDKQMLHEYGQMLDKGVIRKFKKCIKCETVTEIVLVPKK